MATTLDDTVISAPAAVNGSWVRPRPSAAELRVDLGLALALALAALTTSLLYMRTGIFDEYAAPWVWTISLALGTLPLAWRRRYPSYVAIAVAIGFFIAGQFGVPEILILNITLFLALYSVGAWEPNRRLAFWVRFGIAAGVIVWLIVALVISSSDTSAFEGISRSGLFSAYATFAVLQIITNLMYFAGAFFFGERAWRSANAQARLEAQARELDRERRTSAAQAVALDRVAIARELHDVVAHHVSVMGIQAAAARRSFETNPAAATSALEIVESSAQATVEELRQLLHTLREPGPEGISSTLGTTQIPELVRSSQSSGVPTTFIVAGETRPLPMLVDVALYRVVQEALTNVRKHAGRGAEATVRLRFAPEFAEVEVSDNGVRTTLARESELPGLGLRGMRERIGAVGGSVTAGRRETGGFIVRATVPISDPGILEA
ncbi:sensor histidine kinase [Leucobacter denitrificans]|uniref:histidine kinase n=1 Tax=Leucobacter denitrificans TaxID=683042 RepID=A0A7G9S218_9MICO|nr:histidine kinase [Leucobacter denitrificans]QNN61893.1 sensor histidine kinase [Leucobacter denitrificans]